VRALPEAAEILLLPARDENLSVATIEAIASAITDISTLVSVISDAIIDGGTGLLVPQRGVSALGARSPGC